MARRDKEEELRGGTERSEGEEGWREEIERKDGEEGRRGGMRKRDVEERSEEHTSELQSRPHISYAVFCLKKKKSKR